jgi:hypothetical protein
MDDPTPLVQVWFILEKRRGIFLLKKKLSYVVNERK